MSKTNSATTGYIVISQINPALILTTTGEFHARGQCGPGGYCAKVYKTEAAARKSHPGRTIKPLAK